MKVVGTFLRHGDTFVILRRDQNKPNGNLWGLPAGKVEIGEDDRTAATRELFEETGLEVRQQDLKALGSFDFGSGKSAYTFITFEVNVKKEHTVVLEKDGHSEALYVTAQECDARNDLVPDFHKLLRLIGFIKS